MKQRKQGSGIHNGKRGPKKKEKTKRIQRMVPESMYDDLNKVVGRFLKRKIKQHKLKNQK